jgi:hypothetical protein
MKRINGAISTILTISMGLLIVHFITKWEWPVIASLVVGVCGIIFPKLALKIDYIWKALTKLIGAIVQRCVLILIFYLLLFPIAWAAKLFSKNKLLQLSDNSSSTFVDENRSFDKKGFERQW